MNEQDISLSRKQAEAIKALATAGKLNEEKIKRIITGKKVKAKTSIPPITFKAKELEDYLPRELDGDELKKYIIEALSYYLNRMQKEEL